MSNASGSDVIVRHFYFRSYIHIDELKMDLKLDGKEAINVFLITSSWNRASFRGLSTYPWEKNVYTTMGTYKNILLPQAYL